MTRLKRFRFEDGKNNDNQTNNKRRPTGGQNDDLVKVNDSAAFCGRETATAAGAKLAIGVAACRTGRLRAPLAKHADEQQLVTPTSSSAARHGNHFSSLNGGFVVDDGAFSWPRTLYVVAPHKTHNWWMFQL